MSGEVRLSPPSRTAQCARAEPVGRRSSIGILSAAKPGYSRASAWVMSPPLGGLIRSLRDRRSRHPATRNRRTTERPSAPQARAADRVRQLTATLAGRARDDQAQVAATLTELAATIRREALGEDGDQLQLITGLELDAGDRLQVGRDLRSLRTRLDRIPNEIESEQAAIPRRYADPAHRLFPAAVTLLVPEGARL